MRLRIALVSLAALFSSSQAIADFQLSPHMQEIQERIAVNYEQAKEMPSSDRQKISLKHEASKEYIDSYEANKVKEMIKIPEEI